MREGLSVASTCLWQLDSNGPVVNSVQIGEVLHLDCGAKICTQGASSSSHFQTFFVTPMESIALSLHRCQAWEVGRCFEGGLFRVYGFGEE